MKDNNKKKEPWRIAVFIISVVYVIYMWVRKDIIEIITTIPKEDMMPVLIMTIIIYVIKIGIISGILILLKWLYGKLIKGKGKDNKKE